MTKRLIVFTFLSLCLMVARVRFAADLPILGPEFAKLSQRVSTAVMHGNPETIHRLWLVIDTAAVNLLPPQLSDRAWERRTRVDPEGLLVTSHDFRLPPSVVETIEATGARIRHSSRWFKTVSVEAEPRHLAALLDLSVVRYVDLVTTFRRPFPEDISDRAWEAARPTADALWYGNSYDQNAIAGTVKLHAAGLDGTGVRIALFDTGFDTSHVALTNIDVVGTYDFINNDILVCIEDCSTQIESRWQIYHGTQVLGAVGGCLSGTLIGTAYGAEFLLAKTEITCDGTEIKIEEDNWIAAAEWADSAGTDIISSSLGYTLFQDSGSYSQSDLDGNTALITQAADLAASKNILVVTSAGNERGRSWGLITFPADGDSVLAVGAIYHDLSIASFSSPGPTTDGRIKPDIVSLGVDVWIPRARLGGYLFKNGTSFAAPLVAGGAALALQHALEHDTILTAAELLEAIHQSGNRAQSPDNDFGYGIYNATQAADIIGIDTLGPVFVQVDQPITVPVTTFGRSSITPVISGLDLPLGVELQDNDDGSGLLFITGRVENSGRRQIYLVADVGYFADTAVVTLNTRVPSDQAVVAGPNPFTDSVSFFLGNKDGLFHSVSVFNVSGEKVWDSLNISPETAELTWYGRNAAGEPVAAGVYIAFVKTTRHTERVKLLKLR